MENKIYLSVVALLGLSLVSNCIHAQTYILKSASGTFSKSTAWVDEIVPPIDGTAEISFLDGATANCTYKFDVKDSENIISIASIEDSVSDNKMRDIYISANTTLKVAEVTLNAGTPMTSATPNLRLRRVTDADNTNIEITNLNVTSGTVDLGHPTSASQVPTSATIETLRFNNAETTTYQRARIYCSSATVKNIVNDSRSSKIILGGNFALKGDFFQNSNLATGMDASVISLSEMNNALTMDGLMRISGENQYNAFRFASGAKETSVTVTTAGIVGGLISNSSAAVIRWTTGITGYGTDIIITGNGGKNVYGGRIHDLNQTTDPTLTDGAISITMNAADAKSVQYLAGNTYIRGLTTVKNGALFVYGNDDALRTDNRGLSNVNLEGGIFGACGLVANGKVNEIGKIYMTTLSWSGGSLAFDIDAENFDQFILEGDFAKTSAATAFEINFNLNNIKADDGTSNLYKIIDLGETSYCNFTESDFIATGLDEGITANFVVLDKDGVYVSFSGIIPEPSAYAAVFALAALFAAVARGKNRRR